MLDPGAGVVTSRGLVRYVVTEYGVAYLHGKSIRERAKALIEIAHPEFPRRTVRVLRKDEVVAASAGKRDRSDHEVRIMAAPARGKITIDVEECKGCGLCVESCPPKCLELAPELSHTACIRRTIPATTAPDAGSASTAVPSRGRSPFSAWQRPPKAAAAQVQAGGEHAAAL